MNYPLLPFALAALVGLTPVYATQRKMSPRDPLCPPSLAEVADRQGARTHYLELLVRDYTLSAEQVMEAYRRFQRLDEEVNADGQVTAPAASGELPTTYTESDLVDRMINVSRYRPRVAALEAQTRDLFAGLFSQFPQRYYDPAPASTQAVWAALLKATHTPSSKQQVTLFSEMEPVWVTRDQSMRQVAESLATGKLHLVPSEYLLWVETLHGLMVMVNSGVVEPDYVEDLPFLHAKWVVLWLQQFDSSFAILSRSRLAQEVLLEMDVRAFREPDFRDLVVNHLLVSTAPTLLEIRQHFLSLLLVEVDDLEDTQRRIAERDPNWVRQLSPQRQTGHHVRSEWSDDFTAVTGEILKESQAQLESDSARGKLPNILWTREGVSHIQSLLEIQP